MRADFVDDNRYATDCGPICPGQTRSGDDCGQELWVYLAHWDNDLCNAQCASCHYMETFEVTDATERTIGGIKRAHYNAILKNRTLPRRCEP